jgi:5'-nucleotidase
LPHPLCNICSIALHYDKSLTANPESVTYSSGRLNNNDILPSDLRILHYNDVYHVEPGSLEPVGGIARFQTLCNHYAKDEKFKGQSDLLTLFSGDAFNPSLESSVTKGELEGFCCFLDING